jgi:hypothetical protein
MAAALLLPGREDEAMGRIMLALGLAAFAGCGGESGRTSFWGSMTVSNQGSSALHGIAETWDTKQSRMFSLDPGASTRVEFYTDDRVKLHAWRTSDGLLLIDDFWELGDFVHGIQVTLNP